MRRLNRIFRPNGKTVIVAMDHGMSLPVNPALDNTGDIIKAAVAGGADAILTTMGVAKRYEKELRDVALLLRADSGYSYLGKGDAAPRGFFDVRDAVRVGADAVVCMGFPGIANELDCLDNLARLVAEGREWGMPVMAEMLPGGFDPSIPNSIENLTLSARIGCEYGADIIKTTYNGSIEEYRQVIAASYQPVVVLGGEQTHDLPSLFQCLEDAVCAGAAGVAIGRNVWKHEDPEKVTRALVSLVHEGEKAANIKGL